MSACGYYNPYVANNNNKPISLNHAIWANKTGVAGLENTMYQSLSNWLRKCRLIHLVDKPEKAEYLLTGTINSIDFPELSYGNHMQANELRANLHVTFDITDNVTNHKIWTVSQTFTETLNMSTDPTSLQANKRTALLKISEDVSEMIYLHIINKTMRPSNSQNN